MSSPHQATPAPHLPTIETAELRESLGEPELSEDLLNLALIHRSFAYENGGLPTNERLEFLGDSVLGLIVTETLYHTYPDSAEGELAKLRAAVVNAAALAQVGRTIGLGPYIRLGKGEEASGGADKDSILADTVEAVIGAVYLSGGFDAAAEVVHRFVVPLVTLAIEQGAGLDWKTSLQELTAAHQFGSPYYHVTSDGPDHERIFTARVRLGEQEYEPGVGRSKKAAEQAAAQAAYRKLASQLDSTIPQ